tara:strand:- start:894 stop:1316 length:423 start_codon:yes stop_codon:yes gene_type:complete
MVFGIFKSRPDLGVNLKKHSSKKFNKYIETIVKKYKYDDIINYGVKKLILTDDVLQDNMTLISKEWIKEVATILGNELKKKTVGEMFKTLQIFFKSHLDKRLYNSTNLENFYIFLICNVAATCKNKNNYSKSLKKILGIK